MGGQRGDGEEGVEGACTILVGLFAQAVEFAKGAVPGTVVGGDLALDTGEEAGGGGIGEEGGSEVGGGGFGEDGAVEIGLDALEAAFVPVGAEEGIDVEALVGRLGLVGVAIGVGKGLVFGGVFAGEDEGLGVEGVFEGVEAAGGFARSGARSGRFERVGAVGGDLRGGCHDLAITRGRAGFRSAGV